MTFQNRFEIQIHAHRLGREGNSPGLIATVEQDAISQDSVGQRKRGMVENQYLYIISTKLMPNFSHQGQSCFKSHGFRHPLHQKDGNVYIRERSCMTARLGTKKVRQHHVIELSSLFQTPKGCLQIVNQRMCLAHSDLPPHRNDGTSTETVIYATNLFCSSSFL